MTEVFYFSGSGHCLEIAKFFAARLNTDAVSIPLDKQKRVFERMLLIFPVYCQNIPKAVKDFLKTSDTKYAILIAVYGGISFGRVLYDAQKLYSGKIVAGAYFPTGHSYLNDDKTGDIKALLTLLSKTESTEEVKFPKTRKNIFSDFFPDFRSQIGVKIKCSQDCNGCNLCSTVCPMKAIEKGKPDNKCIRCLKCVRSCPQKALSFSLHPILKRYLKAYRYKKDKIILYI